MDCSRGAAESREVRLQIGGASIEERLFEPPEEPLRGERGKGGEVAGEGAGGLQAGGLGEGEADSLVERLEVGEAPENPPGALRR